MLLKLRGRLKEGIRMGLNMKERQSVARAYGFQLQGIEEREGHHAGRAHQADQLYGPWYNGAKENTKKRKKLWGRYFTGAPERRRQPAAQYKTVKRV